MTERTLRDDLAMSALTGMLASAKNVTDILGAAKRTGRDFEKVVASIAYEIADAMLEERKPDPLDRDARGVTKGMRDFLTKGGVKK